MNLPLEAGATYPVPVGLVDGETGTGSQEGVCAIGAMGHVISCDVSNSQHRRRISYLLSNTQHIRKLHRRCNSYLAPVKHTTHIRKLHRRCNSYIAPVKHTTHIRKLHSRCISYLLSNTQNILENYTGDALAISCQTHNTY